MMKVFKDVQTTNLISTNNSYSNLSTSTFSMKIWPDREIPNDKNSKQTLTTEQIEFLLSCAVFNIYFVNENMAG